MVHGADEDVAGEARVKIGPEFAAPAALFENVQQAGIKSFDVGKDLGGHEFRVGLEEKIDDLGVQRRLLDAPQVPPEVFAQAVDRPLDAEELLVNVFEQFGNPQAGNGEQQVLLALEILVKGRFGQAYVITLEKI
jgi:hypothetical protein